MPTFDLETAEALAGITVDTSDYNHRYIVVFDSQGADVDAVPSSIEVEPPETTVGTLPTEPVKAGWYFGGWWTETGGGGTEFSAATTVTGDITVYVYWSSVPTYTVTYDANGADSGTAPGNQTKFHATVLTLATNSGGLEKTGHNFAGWNTQPDGSGTHYEEGAMYIDNADLDLYAQWWDEAYWIGDVGPAGGLIFYVDVGGLYPWTYLEAAPQSTEWTDKVWGGYGTEVTGADGADISKGEGNTLDILNEFGASEPYEGKTDYAAKLCDSLSEGGFTDWFLPSKNELNQMHKNLHQEGEGGFSDAWYWSSTEYDLHYAWAQSFAGSGVKSGQKKDFILRVRAARSF